MKKSGIARRSGNYHELLHSGLRSSGCVEDSAIFEPDLVLAGPGSTVLGGFPEYGLAAIGLTGLDCPANSRSIQGYSGEYFPAIYGHKTASWCRTL